MAEKEYIDRKAVLESISGLTWYSKNKKGVLNIGAVNRKEAYYPAGNVFDAVESAPAADVVEVVRCKDCEHFVKYKCKNDACYSFTICRRGGYMVDVEENDFCSYGERKKQDNV